MILFEMATATTSAIPRWFLFSDRFFFYTSIWKRITSYPLVEKGHVTFAKTSADGSSIKNEVRMAFSMRRKKIV